MASRKHNGSAAKPRSGPQTRSRSQGGEPPRQKLPPPTTLEELYARLRAGAGTVAGVTFQVAVSALLLAAGRAGNDELPVASVRPESFEDVDCELADGSMLLVQAKEHGVGARAIGAADVTEIIAHAAYALTLDAAEGASTPPPLAPGPLPTSGHTRRFAIVTDGRFGSGLPVTGWTRSLGEAITSLPDAEKVRKDLITPLRTGLKEQGVSEELADALIAHTHLVTLPNDLSRVTSTHLEAGLGLHPAVAGLVRAQLVSELGEAAARAREATHATPERRTRADIDAIADSILQAVRLEDLEEAVKQGVCEPADYVSDAAVDEPGFLRGVDVVPAHIAAGLDVVRPEEITVVLEGLASRRHVLIAGPSGSGKSALLWRSARLLERGPRIVRVLSLADPREATLLERHVKRLRPDPTAPVLVCVDNLGRDRTAGWPQARERLLEMRGVMLLGAVRREELTPEITANATVVDPRLTDSAAREIYARLEQVLDQPALAFEEALEHADGLLMEFIALATAGKRLREVLATQVSGLAAPARRLQREALRLVCAAHVLGVAVPADHLPALLSTEPDQVGDALKGLEHEHLITGDREHWHGLHDLRTEVLLDLLHETPPPTLAATFIRALRALAPNARPAAARRAAVRIARRSAATHADASNQDRLAAVIAALEPVATFLTDEITALAAGERSVDAATYAASLLESADRLGTIAYAHALLPGIEVLTAPALDPATAARLGYSMAVDGVEIPFPHDHPMRLIVSSFPPRPNEFALRVGAVLGPQRLTELAAGTNVESALRLCEAGEGLLRLTAKQAGGIYRAHIPALPEGPSSLGSLKDADLRAQLTASLAVLADLHGQAVADALGPVLPRARDAVASDHYGVSVEIISAAPPRDPDAGAADVSGQENRDLVVRTVAFLRSRGVDQEPTAYAYSPGEDPEDVYVRARLLARRLFDACPEADRVEVEMWQANSRPLHFLGHDAGVLSLRAGALARERTTSRNVAFQAAVTQAYTASDWTSRLRTQARIAGELLALLRALSLRLRANDPRRQRARWSEQVAETATRIAGLPQAPISRTAPRPAGQPDLPAGQTDKALRVSDAAKAALTHLAECLAQLARALEQHEPLRPAGSRLAGAPALLDAARRQGAPIYAGIGDTLPHELDELCALYARLITAADQPRVTMALRTRHSDGQLDELLTDLARRACEPERDIVTTWLAEAGIDAQTSIILDPDPLPAWRSLCVLLSVPLESWATAMAAAQNWTEDERAQAGLTGRIVFLATEFGLHLPVGMQAFASIGHALLIPRENLDGYRRLNGLPLPFGPTSHRVLQLTEDLVAYSYAQVRAAQRTTTWQPSPASAIKPDEIARRVREEFADDLVAVDLAEDMTALSSSQLRGFAGHCILELSEVVAREDGHGESLAANSVSFDVAAVADHQANTAATLHNLALVFAMRADAAARAAGVEQRPHGPGPLPGGKTRCCCRASRVVSSRDESTVGPQRAGPPRPVVGGSRSRPRTGTRRVRVARRAERGLPHRERVRRAADRSDAPARRMAVGRAPAALARGPRSLPGGP